MVTYLTIFTLNSNQETQTNSQMFYADFLLRNWHCSCASGERRRKNTQSTCYNAEKKRNKNRKKTANVHVDVAR